ncbi:AGL170Wp [Eremothecium gossypii ATCC 10895]|uniref:AGL170Wp n=1 Tax=Eremothecium gossypii (strain ATCC 10895 / CBS 109.51 / FGSC 9923 / NRRL Y-1056) TaxID=284811 RepID=Q750V9_EREGS|nr:AGL170Wp [Eremothecium gossypii ATCC 10895]AAS54321.1 AGL170Wp [Eremothecium gossypii ATCC 10895]
MEDAIRQARDALSVNDPKSALKILKPYKKLLRKEETEVVGLLEAYSDAYMEDGQLDKAYPLLEQACALDPEGKIGGCGKFFTLGQVVGGQHGLNTLMIGIDNMVNKAGAALQQADVDKVIGGLLTMIEIWMTDLCMEPDAEEQCEQLISKAMVISNENSPEAWSMLGSIRISQTRFAEAAEAFQKSWELFQQKKSQLEEALKAGLNQNQLRSHAEYVELIQPLLALGKMCIELGLYELALQTIGTVKDIDEDNMEGYYLEGFTNYMVAKLELFKANNPAAEITTENIYEVNEHFKDLALDLNEAAIQDYVQDARVALSFVLKLGENADADDEVARELVQGTVDLLGELGGPVEISDLIKLKRGEEVLEEDEAVLESLE